MGPEGPRCAAGRLSGVQVAVLVQGARPQGGIAVIGGILDRLRRGADAIGDDKMDEFVQIEDGNEKVVTGWTEAPAELNGSACAPPAVGDFPTQTDGTASEPYRPTWTPAPETETETVSVEDAVEDWGLSYTMGRAVVLIAGCRDSDDPAGDLDIACELLQKAKRRMAR